MRTTLSTINIPNRTEQVSETTSPKKAKEEISTVRVRDVEAMQKKEKKHRRFFRVQRRGMSLKQERQLFKQMNVYQLKALRNFAGLADMSAHNIGEDILSFILQFAKMGYPFYPYDVRKKIRKKLAEYDPDDAEETNSGVLNNVLTTEATVDSLMYLFLVCRQYDIR